MSIRYSEDFKKEVVKTYMTGNKSITQLAIDYNIAKSSVSKWVNEYKNAFIPPAQHLNLMKLRRSGD